MRALALVVGEPRKEGRQVGVLRVDVILTRPRALIELKWAYYSPGKIYESLWDAVKLALLGPAHSYAALYVGTGASRAEWRASESADLFTGGQIDPRELWERPLRPRGPNYGKTIGEDLIIGARGNRPRKMHRRIAIRPVATCEIAGDFELRVVGIAGIDPVEEWSPNDADPGGVPPEPDLESVELPARVTQAWIERTGPRLKPVAIGPFLRDLRVRGWSDDESWSASNRICGTRDSALGTTVPAESLELVRAAIKKSSAPLRDTRD